MRPVVVLVDRLIMLCSTYNTPNKHKKSPVLGIHYHGDPRGRGSVYFKREFATNYFNLQGVARV